MAFWSSFSAGFVQCARQARRDVGLSQAPDALEEAVRAFDAGVGPFRLMSGGEANIMNRRQVSAPYWSIID